MATQEDVRQIALSLPDTEQSEEGFAFGVKHGTKSKGFAWVWQERIEPKKPRIPNPEVIALRVADADEKAALLASDTEKFFTEPHYNGFPAILVRLPMIDVEELTELVIEAWRCMAPRSLVREFDAQHQKPASANAGR